MELNGMAAVITGGESGIGAASAIQIANAGAAVAITYLRDRTAAQASVDAIKQAGGRALAVQTAVTTEAQVEALFTAEDEACGPVMMVVNYHGRNIGGIVTADKSLPWLELVLRACT